MLGAGIHPNDILVLDRSMKPTPGKIVICAQNSKLTIKRLQAEISDYVDIPVYGEVATNVIHPL